VDDDCACELNAAKLRLQFFDTRVGALERLVLDKGCLHQRVGGLRRASQAVRDHVLGSRVAGAILQFGQAIEQFFHQFLLLRCHAALPGVHIRRLCGLPGGVTGGVTHAPRSVELAACRLGRRLTVKITETRNMFDQALNSHLAALESPPPKPATKRPPRRPRPAGVHLGSHKANSACRSRDLSLLPPLPLHNFFAQRGPALPFRLAGR
jgi:hypothetical protein